MEVFPENGDAMRVFLALSCEWEKPGLHGGRMTIPVPDIESCIRLMDVPDPRDCFWRIQLIKRAARNVMIEQFNRDRGNG